MCKSHLVHSYNQYVPRHPQCLLRRLYLQGKKYIFTVHDYVNEVLESLKTKKFAGQVFLLIDVGEKNNVLQLALSRGQITLYRLKILLRWMCPGTQPRKSQKVQRRRHDIVTVICLPTKHLGVTKNPFKRVRPFLIECEFGRVGFWEEGKNGVPGGKPLGARERTNNKLNPHTTSSRDRNPGHIGGGGGRVSGLTTAPHVLSMAFSEMFTKIKPPISRVAVNFPA